MNKFNGDKAMNNNLELTCINCPMGCRLRVTIKDGVVAKVANNQCPRGIAYAKQECVDPQRLLTTTVPIHGADINVLPVKTSGPIPKDRIFECIDALKGFSVYAPIMSGDVIFGNIAGTGVDIVATRTVDKQ